VQLIQGAGIDLTTGGNSGAGTVTIAATNNGTVTSVGITAPAAGITVSGSPITTSGSITLALANDLATIEGLTSTGIAVRTDNATSAWATRSLTAANPVTVSNNSGVGGNPFIFLNAGDFGDVDITNSNIGSNLRGDIWTIDTGSINSVKIANSTILFEDIAANSATNGQVIKYNGSAWVAATDETGGGGVTDGDKGDIDVTASGATWTVDTSAISTIKIADAAVTYAKIQDVAANSVLARVGTTSGTAEAVALANSNLLGRGTGANNVGAISLGSNLAITLNALNTTGHPTITGTPTTNAIPKWTSASALGSTIVQESISGADTIIQIVGRDALRLPLGTTAERPGTPTSGMTRYNTTTGAFEYYNASAWETPLLSATGTGLDTAGRVLFANANGKAGGSNSFVWNSTNNQLVIGLSTDIINAAANIIEIKGSGNTNLGNVSYGGRAQWNSVRANGTPASPTAVNNGDGIGQFSFSPYDGTNFQFPTAIRATIDGAVSAGTTPAKIEFFTGSNISARAQRFVIRSDGKCGFSTDTPENTVQINGSLGRKTPVTVTATPYAVLSDDTWIIVNRSASTTITLPAAADWDGREITIKTIQAQTVISGSSNVVPIDSGTAGTAILPATDGAWALLVSDGTNWVIMQRG
jgi:hypothetical protein